MGNSPTATEDKPILNIEAGPLQPLNEQIADFHIPFAASIIPVAVTGPWKKLALALGIAAWFDALYSTLKRRKFLGAVG